jgi:hypothetical protein
MRTVKSGNDVVSNVESWHAPEDSGVGDAEHKMQLFLGSY